MRNLLAKASSLFRRKKYSQVIALLEPALPMYRQSFRFYYLLGMSCIYQRDWTGGYNYIKSAYTINDSNIYIGVVWAMLLIRNREFNEGLLLLLNIVDNREFYKQNGYKRAKRLLNMVRKCGKEKDVVETIDQHLSKYLPAAPFNYFPLLIASSLLAVSFLLFFFIKGVFLPSSFLADFSINHKNQKRSAKIEKENYNPLEAMVINEQEKISDFSAKNSFEIVLTDKQIQESFRLTKNYLENHQDNYARKEVNKLLLSNASFDIKEKAKSFSRVIKEPKDMRHFDQNFSFEEVHDFPQLYNRCFVKWRGRLTLLKIEKEGIFFDFLVGYEDRKKIDGIIKSCLDFEVLLNEDFAYEILAQIEIDESYKKNLHSRSSFESIKASYSLHVVAIRRIEG